MPIPFQRKANRFDAIGVDFNDPVDRIRDGFYPILENMRPESDGSISPRPGQGNGLALVGGQSPVHSIKRMQDTSSSSLVETLLAGVGTHVASSDTALTTPVDLSSGWSGDPLSMVIHQPRESVKPYCYICDRSKMQKIDVGGARKQIGLPRPTDIPIVTLSLPNAKIVDNLDTAANWLAGGTAAALAANLRVDPATRSITALRYDLGFPVGWASVRPSSMADIGKGMELSVVGGAPETFIVQDVYQGSAQTTIARAKYDPEGNAWIHLATPIDQIEVDSMVLLDTGGIHGGPEYVRVQAVERTKTGFTSFRCSTTNTYSTGETAQVVPSFRAYFAGVHIAGDPLTSTALQFTVAAGTGYITRNVGAATPLDMSVIAPGVPTKPDDLVHLSILTDRPDLVTEVKIYADIDSATTNVFAVGTDFKKNYLLHAVRQNDLVPVTLGTQTALANAQTQYQRKIVDHVSNEGSGGGVDSPISLVESEIVIDRVTPPGPDASLTDPNPGNSEDQTSAGINQYAEVFFRISELLTPGVGRAGSDFSRGLANVAALKIEVIATGAVTMRVDSLIVGGGFGPDVLPQGRPRIYRERYRDSSTGVVSNWGPASRGGVRPRRQKVAVVLTGIDTAANPEIDKIDVAVYGGTLEGWSIAGSVDNPGAAATVLFEDIFSEEELTFRQALTEGNIHYQLWPVASLPVQGLGTGAGTIFSLSTGAISASMAPGTAIRVNGLDYTLYRAISTSAFETVESMGAPSAVRWEIPVPIIENQRLPIFAGPFHGFYFGCGDKLNPWRVYYTNGDDPDSTQDDHWFDLGSETVQNIVILEDGNRCIAFTTERIYSIEPALTLSTSGGGLFIYRQLFGGIGLPQRFFIGSDGGSRIAFGSREGIYEMSANGLRCLSTELGRWWPHERSPGVTVNGFVPPDLTQATKLRLGYVDSELFFDYADTNGAPRTIVYHEESRILSEGQRQRNGWRPYVYAAGAQLHYAEEGDKVSTALIGGTDGKIYRIGRALADAAGAAIVAKVRTGSEDFSDPVTSKYLGDVLLDYDRDGATITVTPGFNNHGTTATPVALSTGAGRQQARIDFGSGAGQRGRNVSLEITASVTTQRPIFYLWHPAFQPRPETTLLRAPDFDLVGGEGVKWVRGIWIHADTYNVARTANLKYTNDDGTVGTLAITGIQHAVLEERFYPISGGIYLTSSQLIATDAGTWDLVNYRLEAEPAPPLSTQPSSWLKPFPDSDYQSYVQGLKIDIDTGGAAVRLQIQVDGNVVQTTIQTGAHGGTINSGAGRAVIARSFDVPFITHLIRVVPLDPCRIFNVMWEANPEPELAYMWWPQQTDFGMPGFKLLGDGYISVRSTDEIKLEFEVDGATINAVFYDASTNSAGARRRYRYRLPASGAKGKIARPKCYAATTAGRVSVFEKEFSLQVKEWGSEGSWQWASLMGDAHFTNPAKI